MLHHLTSRLAALVATAVMVARLFPFTLAMLVSASGLPIVQHRSARWMYAEYPRFIRRLQQEGNSNLKSNPSNYATAPKVAARKTDHSERSQARGWQNRHVKIFYLVRFFARLIRSEDQEKHRC